MTVALYARRKQWPLSSVTVRLRHARIHAADCAECETKEGKLDRIEREILLSGPLTDEQRSALLGIAQRCPVHKTLISEIDLPTPARAGITRPGGSAVRRTTPLTATRARTGNPGHKRSRVRCNISD